MGVPHVPVSAGRFGPEAAANPRPGSRGYLKWYWCFGPGRAKWSTWTELHSHLRKFMSPGMAKRVTSAWYHTATGHWVGEKKGKNPLGYG
jgi:hypothetical protein